MSIRLYVLRRLVLIIPLLIGLTLLTFIISRVLPGDPVGLAAGPQATAEIKEALRREFGLDQPLPAQYLNYLTGVVRGDWGESLYSRRSVIADISTYFPATLELTITAIAIAAALGVPAGVISALYRNKLPDQITRVLALFFVSFPAFWLAMIFQLIFGLELGWFPVGRRFAAIETPPAAITGMYVLDSLLHLDFESMRMALSHLFVPALVLSFGSLASITRITRASMLEALDKDYVRMERAIGIPNRVIVTKYVLRNAMIATITIISLEFGWLLAGAVLVETIFDFPGMGLYAVESSLRLDFQPIMGITLIYGVVFSLINILTDVVYGILDPRIRYG
ncbi:MAG: ABC transporter permease [Anaerolineae bacterium]|nr:ABC transporter permease [Anaerolineae bacterium]